MKVFVAMSGGVDSSVAAFLLKKRGFDVYGVHMKEWNVPGSSRCRATDEDRQMAARVAAHLHIPFAVWDFRDAYKKEVVDYMVQEYARGRTPNPDVMCNTRIKFGSFLEKALEQGACYIATGHYVRLMRKSKIPNPKSKTNHKILTARDSAKDQSYFLWTLTQEQLKHCLFPIGDYEKKEVREIARSAGIPSWDKKDSQGICFTGELELADFLRSRIPHHVGAVVTTTGEEIGAHDGVPFFTIGQRHGFTSGKTQPLYVAEKDMRSNTLIVTNEKGPALYKKELTAADTNWVSGAQPKLPMRCLARIRYRQPLQKAYIQKSHSSSEASRPARFETQFEESQRAITPGQSVVFYTKNGQLLGGGIILG